MFVQNFPKSVLFQAINNTDSSFSKSYLKVYPQDMNI